MVENKTQSYVDVFTNAKDYNQQSSCRNEDKKVGPSGKSNAFNNSSHFQQNFNRNNFKVVEPSRRYTPRYQTLFLGNYCSCSNFGHKAINYKANTVKKQPKEFHGQTNRNQNLLEVLNRDMKCFMCHNFGHKVGDWRAYASDLRLQNYSKVDHLVDFMVLS